MRPQNIPQNITRPDHMEEGLRDNHSLTTVREPSGSPIYTPPSAAPSGSTIGTGGIYGNGSPSGDINPMHERMFEGDMDPLGMKPNHVPTYGPDHYFGGQNLVNTPKQETPTGPTKTEVQQKEAEAQLQQSRTTQQQIADGSMEYLADNNLLNQHISEDIYQMEEYTDAEGNKATRPKVDPITGDPLLKAELQADPAEAARVVTGPATQGTAAQTEASQAVTSTNANVTNANRSDSSFSSAANANATNVARSDSSFSSAASAEAYLATFTEGKAITAEEHVSIKAAQDVIARDFEASLIPMDEVGKSLDKLRDIEPMKASSVASHMNELLSEMENGNVPLWARPAVTKVEQSLAGRGIGASSIGRDSLFNAIISAAMPIAQSDANLEQDSNKTNYQSKVQALFNDEAQRFAAKQFNATSINQTNQFISNLKAQVDMSNAARKDAMSQFNSSQRNQVNMFNTQQINDMTKLNTSERNATARANAQMQTNVSMANAQMQTQSNIANAEMSGRFDLADSSAANQAALANAQMQTQSNMANAEMSGRFDLANADAANRLAMSNADRATQVAMSNRDSADRLAMSNADRATQVAMNNAQMANQLAQHQSTLDANREQFNTSAANAIAQADVAWRRQLNTAETAAINAANQANVSNAFNLNNQALQNLWQESRDKAHWAETATENEKAREHEGAMRLLVADTETAAAEGGASSNSAWDRAKDAIITKGINASFDWLESKIGD